MIYKQKAETSYHHYVEFQRAENLYCKSGQLCPCQVLLDAEAAHWPRQSRGCEFDPRYYGYHMPFLNHSRRTPSDLNVNKTLGSYVPEAGLDVQRPRTRDTLVLNAHLVSMQDTLNRLALFQSSSCTVLLRSVTILGATVAERLERSPPTEANRAQSPAGSPDFRKWESCRTMPLAGGSSRGSLVSLAPSFRRRSIFHSITLIGSQALTVKSCPNIFTHSPRYLLTRAFKSLAQNDGCTADGSRNAPQVVVSICNRTRICQERNQPACPTNAYAYLDYKLITEITLASHRGEPGSIPGRVTVFSQVGIVLDNAVGRRVFSGISRFPHPFIPAPLHIYLNQPHRLSRPRCIEPPKSLHSLTYMARRPDSELLNLRISSRRKTYNTSDMGRFFKGLTKISEDTLSSKPIEANTKTPEDVLHSVYLNQIGV
ncbi:hypothetical protein PR048_009218 [Dryococelus australis]|uniref:Uncharacterized protein n=1 Tax=Dryococelus australis TaxID=614101 RepID=A0ABQ9HZN0_9NEOP|nr:hypothetical protein PR048_009218 [Dryococelus australis]